MKRRTILAGMGAAILGGGLVSSRQYLVDTARAVARRVLNGPQPDPSTGTGQLTDHELATLEALGEVILPSLPAGLAAEFSRGWTVTRAATVPGYLAQYRAAVPLLDAPGPSGSASSPFRELDVDERNRRLSELLPRYSARDWLHRVRERFLSRQGPLRLRTLVVQDLLAGFYGSAEGWATLGYTHYPGLASGDPLAYTRPPISTQQGTR